MVQVNVKFIFVLDLEIEWTNLVNQVACAQSNLKRCTLELGGKSPLVVCDDVENFEEAVSTTHIITLIPKSPFRIFDDVKDFEGKDNLIQA